MSPFNKSLFLPESHSLTCFVFQKNTILYKRKFLQEQGGKDYTHLIIYSFNKCSCHVYHVPAVVLKAEDAAVNKTEEVSVLTELMSEWRGKTINKQETNEQDNFH